MPPMRPPVSKAAQPVLGNNFDPFHSSSTGHQRAEARGPSSGTGWRDAQNYRLQTQYLHGKQPAFKAHGKGRGQVSERARVSVMEMLAKPGTMKARVQKEEEKEKEEEERQEERPEKPVLEFEEILDPEWIPSSGQGAAPVTAREVITTTEPDTEHDSTPPRPPGSEASHATPEEFSMTPTDYAKLFEQSTPKPFPSPTPDARPVFGSSVVVYINGSTWPLISDHRLRQLLAEHGARLSSHLARRQVTHVILGRPSTGPGRGAGGGLAAGKLDKEIRKKGGSAVKYVNVEWVLESIKAGQRLPESRFSDLKIAAANQRGIHGAITKMGTSQRPSGK